MSVFPRIAQIFTEPSCCIFSHGIHGIHRTFLLYILPQIALFFMFSHGIHGTHRTFLLYILPQIAQIFTDAAFKGVHLSQVHQPVLLLHFLLCWCTSCSVGALETSAPP